MANAQLLRCADPGAVGVCDSNPCQHFGSCVDQGTNYTCHCLYGYTGVSCEKGERISGFQSLIWATYNVGRSTVR